MFHNQDQQDAFEDEEAPTPYECYREQFGVLGANWGELEAVLWLALIGAGEHARTMKLPPREYLNMTDTVYTLVHQLPEPIAEEFRKMWDDAYPQMRGRY